jgi:uncharacterized protein
MKLSRRSVNTSLIASMSVLLTSNGNANISSDVGPAANRDLEHGTPLNEFTYGAVSLSAASVQQAQLEQTHTVLMGLDEEALLRPFRMAAGLPAPGRDLGGWHSSLKTFGPESFGHWMSALSRYYAATGDEATRSKVQEWLELFSATVDSAGSIFRQYKDTSCCMYNKLFCGLEDAYHYAGLVSALGVMERLTTAAIPYMPGRALPQTEPNNGGESYIIPEYQFLAWQWGADTRHLEMAKAYLYDDFFDPLARGENVLSGRHAYSHVNSLCSAAKAYLVLGDEKYLKAAINGLAFVEKQSFATGGWGPGEKFLPRPALDYTDPTTGEKAHEPAIDSLADSLSREPWHFETPCGAHAHLKLTRYLLRITKSSLYGDSMERVMYNTVLGALPLNKFGKAFYQSNYHARARKAYFDGYDNSMEDAWPCCSGTLPQVAADYRISAYFQDTQGIFVNLYIPSTLRWHTGDAHISLMQSGSYPLDEEIQFEVTASKSSLFDIRLRIPSWTREPSVFVNGRKVLLTLQSGTFATIRRQWKTGDTIELRLPRGLDIQPIDAQHPNTVALVCGPLVLFAVSEDTPKVTSERLLSAKQTARGSSEWLVHSDEGPPLRFAPFWTIKDETYFTYLQV